MGCLIFGRWHHAGPSAYGTSMASHSSWPPLLGPFATWLAWVAKKIGYKCGSIQPYIEASGHVCQPLDQMRTLWLGNSSTLTIRCLAGLPCMAWTWHPTAWKTFMGSHKGLIYDTLMGSQQGSWSIHGLPKKAHVWQGLLKICDASMGSQNCLKILHSCKKMFSFTWNRHWFQAGLEGYLCGLPFLGWSSLCLRCIAFPTGTHAIKQWLILSNGCLIVQIWNCHIVNGEMGNHHVGFLVLPDLLAPVGTLGCQSWNQPSMAGPATVDQILSQQSWNWWPFQAWCGQCCQVEPISTAASWQIWPCCTTRQGSWWMPPGLLLPGWLPWPCAGLPSSLELPSR